MKMKDNKKQCKHCKRNRHGKKVLALIAILGVVVFAMVSCGHRHHGFAKANAEEVKEMADKMVKRVGWHLDLTDSQKADLNNRKNILVKEGLPLLERRKKTANTILSAIENDRLDAANINTLIDDGQEDRQAFRRLAVSHAVEFYATLNADQKEEIIDHVKDIREELNE